MVKHRVEGKPDPKHVSTSYVERINLNLEHGSEDPADPQKTTRVLTVMLEEELRMP